MAEVLQYGRGEEGLLFFLPNLQPIYRIDPYAETGVEPETPQPAIPFENEQDCSGAGWNLIRDPLRRLAWHLVGSRETSLSVWQAASAAFLPAARLGRARALLRQIEDLEHRGSGSEEHWKILEQEWHWVATSASAKRLLVEQAQKIGLPEPEPAAASVLKAVKEELLKVLRIRSYFISAGSSRIRHRRALLRNWKDVVSPGVVDLYIEFLHALSAEESLADHASDAVAGLLANPSMTKSTSRRLQDASGRVLTAWFDRWMKNSPTQLAVERELRRLENLERAGIPHLLLFECLSALYLLQAVKSSKSKQFDQPMQDLGRALTYNPFNKVAREQLEKSSQQIQELKGQLPKLSFDHRVTASSLLDRMQETIRDAEAFNQTPEGKKITARRGEAIKIELAVRMGLDLDDKELPSHLAALAKALQESAPYTENRKRFADKVAQLARAASEPLASVNWEPILEALRKNPAPSIEVLAITLPKPVPLSQAPQIAEDLKRLGKQGALPPAPAFPARWRSRLLDLATWLFSPRDAWAKAVAGIGLVLLLFAGTSSYLQYRRESRLETAYHEILNGVQSKNDALVVSQALPFLRQAGGTSDPRAAQVQELYQESLMREVVRLVEAGEEKKAMELLKSSESVITRAPADA